MDFSETLYTLRKKHALTQEQLAERLDVSRQSVSKWEAGQAMPEPDKIVALSDLFGVTTDTLLKPSGEPAPLPGKSFPDSHRDISGCHTKRRRQVLIFVVVYLLAFAILLFLQRLEWQVEWLWELFPGLTLYAIILSAATACAIGLCLYGEK